MPDTKRCAECGTPLPAYWPKGLCPRCALDGALAMTNAASQVSGREEPIPPSSPQSPQLSANRSLLGSFGDYDLLEEIARGGMGVVYKARQRKLGRIVAVKMILAGPLAGKEFVQRFRTESAAAAILQHPNIVAIHDVGVHEGRHYFSMDHVEGQSLTQLVGQQPLTPVRAARYTALISVAIHYAHERGILHRDLKPSNVLIDSNDQPRITDFGLAKRLDGESTLTLSGHVLGSPNFMPPEQAGGKHGKVGRPSDVYALGGILYYLLTARAPFQAESLEQIIAQVLHAEPVSPRLLNPSVPRDLETITLKCLEKEPSRRYQTAQELADELGRVLHHEPIRARPITQPEKLWRWCRRKPALTTALGFALAALMIGLATTSWQWRRAERLAVSERQGRIAGQRQLYVATMNLAQAAWEQNYVSRAKQLLEDTAGAPERGFEWYYWQRQMHLELRAFRGHTGPILAVAYSPDGERIITGSADHSAKVWDAETGKELFPLEGHTAPIRSVAFFADGRQIVTGGWDQTARVWDTATGEPLHILKGHRNWILSVAVSPNGQRIATGSLDHTAMIWDATTGNLLLEFTNHGHGVWAVAFSPDGQRVVSGSWDKTARVWDANSKKELAVLANQSDAVFSAAFSPDGQSIVTGGKGGTVRLWDAGSGALRQTFDGHERPVFAVRFSPDGRRIISGSDDQTARIWDITTGKSLRVLKGHGSRIGSVAYSPDGQRIITGGGAVRVSPNGEDVDFTVGDDNAAKVWDAAESREMNTLKANGASVMSVDFSPDGKLIASGSLDGAVRLWDLRSGRELWVGTNNAMVRSVAFFPDGRRIVTGCWDHTATVWEVATGKKLFPLEGHTERLFSVAVSPDGHWIATGSWDSTVRLWEAASGRQVSTFRGHGARVYPVAFSRDGRRIVSGGGDGVARVWDVESRMERLPLKQQKQRGPIWSAAFSHNDRRIVTGTHGLSATVWDATTGEKQMTLSGHTAQIHTAVFSPDDSRILTSSGDHTAKLWDSSTGQELLTLRGHTESVLSAAFSPDGQRIVTGSGDGTVKVWEAATRDQVAKWQEVERTTDALKPASGNPR